MCIRDRVRTAAVQLKNRDDAASITIKIGGSEMCIRDRKIIVTL